MARIFNYGFIGADNTQLITAYPEFSTPAASFLTAANTTQGTLFFNTLRRPASQANQNPKVDINSAVVPDDFEAILEFAVLGATNYPSNYVGLIIKADTSAGTMHVFRYRANAGYQYLPLAAGTLTIGSTNTKDINPTSISAINPFIRRLRVRVESGTATLRVDSFNNTTKQWLIDDTILLTVNGIPNPGKVGLMLSSITNTYSNSTVPEYPNDGYIVTRLAAAPLDGSILSIPSINSTLTASATTGTAFSYTITATNTPTLFSAASLPAGLSVNTSTGVISGTPTSAGSSNVTIVAGNADGSDSETLVLTVSAPLSAPTITSSLTASGTVNSAFSYQITATGTPTSYNATGLPSGLSVNTSTGVISGTTTAAATTNISISATNAQGTDTKTLVLTVGAAAVAPTITSSLTAGGTTGTAFSYQITATGNPTSYNATGLPAGLSVNTSTGVISGTPTTAATTNISISATNAQGTDTKTLVLTVNSSLQPPVITSALAANATVGVAFTYNITATNTPTSYAATGLPAGLSVNTSTGVISGTPTTGGTVNSSLTATNAAGTSAAATLVFTVATVATTPGAPTGLGLNLFSPLRNDSPLNNAFLKYTHTLKNLAHLQWTAPTETGSTAITGYRLEGSANGTTGWTLIRTTTTTRAYSVAKPTGNYFVRVAAINSSGIGAYSSVFTIPGTSTDISGSMIQVNGCWTFFTIPLSVCYRGKTYTGWVNNAGIVGVTQTDNITKTSVSTSLEDVSAVTQQFSGAEIDDHDNAAIFILPDGRIACYYGAHNDPAGMRFRVSVRPEDISEFTSPQTFSPVATGVSLPTCYSNPRHIQDAGLLAYHFRTGTPPNAPHAIFYTDISNNLKTPGAYSTAIPLLLSTQAPWSSQRPYVHSAVNGRDRIDVVHTDGHPADPGTNNNGNGTSLFHFYIKWDKISKSIKYYRSNGEEITTLPIRPKISGGGTDETLVFDGTTIRTWIWDVIIHQGNPWVLFTTYDNGAGSFGYSNQRYMFTRWNGTAWTTAVDITGANVASTGSPIRGVAVAVPGMAQTGVNGALSNEPAYTGGICFDSQNPMRVYASVPVRQTTAINPDLTSDDPFPIREIQEWGTDNTGLTWTKRRDITKNSPPNVLNLRPMSPRNHDGNISVVFLSGAYSHWARGFNTNVWCASSSSPERTTEIIGGLALSRTGQVNPILGA